ncbi:putative polysaccharide biosynthesis protein [Gordonia polyisoprenivorans VH2]|uniref:Putative polysaccharide biosynthesis protein n=1 Tax=Gordonia polyisoprenivorans (strain DSM 44266 / VH2) TaxID=1112204 RepID=H6N1N0_GORPV|nr:oligosaccharide flippase family protein [Gordonia polyisoprenivorans]AFA73349.1 putative polysaccharide biosynthesis protein [Gordonia polyisoprenivorans VH2]MBE7191771.1 oligosaccharide flippase family protein [Gordonia polyisoprenivorans]QUD85154.1 oligosaccharide flippase family protein [Gordonia polyisoprenivorans]HCS58608.1 polysaccharide biosynthesis protein [Gordonia polyisoprenivorans]
MIAARADLSDGPAPTGQTIARSSAALVVSGLGTAVLGLVYWVLAGRMYPASEVGAAAAVITTATMLSAFGNLGIGAYLERFLPIAGERSLTLPSRGLLIGASCGALLGCGFLIVGPTSEMFDGAVQMWMFPIVVVVLSSFAMLDHVSIAMGRADWSAQKNIVHAVAKLAAAAALALSADRLGLIGSWVVTAAIAAALLWWFARRELRLRAADLVSTSMALPAWRTQRRFLAGNYGVYVAGAITPLILPPVVIARVGADQNAYFSIVWSLVSAVLVLLTMLLGPYVAAMSADDAARPANSPVSPNVQVALRRTRQFVAILVGGAMVAALVLIVIGPVFLRLAGADYAAHGTVLLRLGATALPLAAVGLAFVGICRVRCRLGPALAVQMISAVTMLSLTAAWIGDHGLIAAGWAMVIAEGTAATLVAVPLARALGGRAQLGPS